MSGLDFGTSGVAGKLVFVGAAITTALALGDQLDSVLTDEQQTAFAVANIVALLVAGSAPLVVLGLQARYRPVWPKSAPVDPPPAPALTEPEALVIVAHAILAASHASESAHILKGSVGEARRNVELAASSHLGDTASHKSPWLALGDETLVASVPGVVLGSAVTAAAVVMQIGALEWAAHEATVGDWTKGGAIALAVGVSLYCVTVAGSIAVNGRRPPLVDKPDDAAPGAGNAAAVPARQFLP
jgi:hypothetical protein